MPLHKTNLDEVEGLCNQVLADIKRVRKDKAINVELAKKREADGQWHYDERLRGENVRTANLKRHSMDLTRALAALRKTS